jgi:hypothetical protein
MSETALLLFMLIEQAERLNLRVVALNRGRCVQIELEGVHRAAWLCEKSSEYHYHRLALHDVGRTLSLVICLKHNSTLPVEVLSLEEGVRYSPYTPPSWYDHSQRRTRKGNSVFMGQLRCGIGEAWDILATLPRSTRNRYKARLKNMIRGHRGRPVTIATASNTKSEELAGKRK